MNRIDTSFASVTRFFETKNTQHASSDKIPDHLKGIWELSDLKNMSILMSFDNAIFNKEKRRITVKLYEPGNWLFGEENLANRFFLKFFKYSYQFDFNETYEHATIKIKLGIIPIHVPKYVSKWTVEFDKLNNKMIRRTTFFGNEHLYKASKITSDKELSEIHNFDYFFYC